jgi:hypothetical protein
MPTPTATNMTFESRKLLACIAIGSAIATMFYDFGVDSIRKGWQQYLLG